MKRTAFVIVGPPPARTSGFADLPTRMNINIIGTVVGNIIAIMPIVQDEENKTRATASSWNIPTSIIIGCWRIVIHHEIRAIPKRLPAMSICSGVKGGMVFGDFDMAESREFTKLLRLG